jgi:hypothetical protein
MVISVGFDNHKICWAISVSRTWWQKSPSLLKGLITKMAPAFLLGHPVYWNSSSNPNHQWPTPMTMDNPVNIHSSKSNEIKLAKWKWSSGVQPIWKGPHYHTISQQPRCSLWKCHNWKYHYECCVRVHVSVGFVLALILIENVHDQ